MKFRPFMSYYGGKWSTAHRYPQPGNKIIEPFAGGAGYSVRYPDRDVTLIDVSPQVVGVWQYLIATSAAEILRLPLLAPGQIVNDLTVCQEARWLIGWWVNKGVASPHQTMSAWARNPEYAYQFWGPEIRARIARQVDGIRHWKVLHGSYELARPDGETTTFVDPPYNNPAGARYPHSSVDYGALGAWCKDLPGVVVVCEQGGADWLPFEPIGEARSTRARVSGKATRCEVAWIKGASE